MAEKILFITAFKLERNGKDGGPNNLSGMIYDYLCRQGREVDLFYRPEDDDRNLGPIESQRDIFALRKRKLDVGWEDYDYVVVFPDILLYSMPDEVLSKTIVIGPDATSMARWSKYRACASDPDVSSVKRIYQYAFAQRFLAFEKKYIPRVKRYVVVGINDRRWLRRRLDKADWDKVFFLPHPLLESALVNLDTSRVEPSQRKRFVFSGSMRYSYVGRNIRALKDAFDARYPDAKLEVLVVGRDNKWMADILSETSGLDVTYIEWVDDYQDICQIGRDVHCVPLIAGAGTKNRVLVALANGLEVISTPKGVENIPITGLTHLTVKKRMDSFADAMVASAGNVYTAEEIRDLIDERKDFRTLVRQKYEDAMAEIFPI